MALRRAMVNAIAITVTFHSASSSHVRHPLATVMSLERPSRERLEAFLARRQGQAFNHPFAGCTSLEASSVCAHPASLRVVPPPSNTTQYRSVQSYDAVPAMPSPRAGPRAHSLPMTSSSNAWQAEPLGWTELEFGTVVGHGRACYERVSQAMQQWQVMDTVSFVGSQRQRF